MKVSLYKRGNEIVISYFSFQRTLRGLHATLGSNAIYLNFTLAALICIFMPYENQTRYDISVLRLALIANLLILLKGQKNDW